MIDDESKKFIKETIENAIDDKLSERDKKTESQKKLDSINYQKKELEDRKKLLAELSERDKKGQATIAEKFEKLKLSVDTSIPQDLKDAWKTGAKGVQAGANQVGKGIGHLTARAMMSNPLTAFLYQNRDIAGAIGDIGIGSIKAGWGALKGIGHGALGLANSAKNLFNRDEEEETEEILNLPKPSFSGNSQAEKLVKEKSNWEKQINEMHTIITQDLTKNQKKSSEIMGKGLKGLDDNMKAIKGFTDTMATKQKLILGGIMLGAAALVGIIAWLKSGGWKNLFKNPLEKPVNDSFTNKDINQSTAFDMDAKGSALSGIKGIDQQKLFNKKPELLTGISNTETKTVKALDGNGNSIDLTTMKFKTGDLTPVLAPYDGRVYKLNKQTNKTGDKIVNVRWVMVIGPVDTEKYPTLSLKNITSPQLQPNEDFKEGDILAYATSEFSMENYYGYENNKMQNLNNYQSNVNKAKANNYKDNLQRLATTKTDKKTDKLNDFMYKKDRASYNAQKHSGDKLGNATEKVHDFFSPKDQDIERNRWEAERLQEEADFINRNFNDKNKGVTTGQAAPIISTNISKAQEQNKKLNEKKEEPKIEQGTLQGQGYIGQLPNLNIQTKDKTTAYRTADKVTTSELADMSPNTTVNIAAVNN